MLKSALSMPRTRRDGAISMPVRGRIKAKDLVLEPQIHTYAHADTHAKAGRRPSDLWHHRGLYRTPLLGRSLAVARNSSFPMC